MPGQNPALTVPRADLGRARKCCVLSGPERTQCPHDVAFWVGPEKSNGIDDYTEVCADHVDTVRDDDDTVVALVDGVREDVLASFAQAR